MDGPSLRVDLRVVAFATTALAIAAAVGLLVASSSTEEALAQVALVLAIVALLADLGIALASHMASAQSEARMRETNTQMQAAITKLDARTDEIREHVLAQGGRMLDMLGQRLIEATPEEDRRSVQAVVANLQKELREEPLKPPDGGLAGRTDVLRDKLLHWVESKGGRAVEGPSPEAEGFELNGSIYIVKPVAGPAATRFGEHIDLVHMIIGEMTPEWPDHKLLGAVLVEEPSRSRWNGEQRFANDGLRIVTSQHLDELLLGRPTKPQPAKTSS